MEQARPIMTEYARSGWNVAIVLGDPVIPSEVKNLRDSSEILRFAQRTVCHDSLSPPAVGDDWQATAFAVHLGFATRLGE